MFEHKNNIKFEPRCRDAFLCCHPVCAYKYYIRANRVAIFFHANIRCRKLVVRLMKKMCFLYSTKKNVQTFFTEQKKCSSKNVFVRLFFDPPNFQFSAADILHSSRATRRKRDGRPLTEHQSSSRTLVFSHFETSRFFARREPSRRKDSPSSGFFCRGPLSGADLGKREFRISGGAVRRFTDLGEVYRNP